MMARQKLIKTWLKNYFKVNTVTLTIASADASFRRYFRAQINNKNYIVMDAPLEHESLEPFTSLAELFRTNGINTPKIFACDTQNGFLLLNDFGDVDLLHVLNADNADNYYHKAIEQLIKLQNVQTSNLPKYDKNLFLTEMRLFTEWYLDKNLQLTLSSCQIAELEALYQKLAQMALSQPQVPAHRDYHSRNLMVLPDDTLGVIDFQDAVCGPVTYDLVSLLKDCYIAWHDDKVTKWVQYYLQLTSMDLELGEFRKWFDWMGMQRHLKVIGIFSRLNIRDNKPKYLKDIPQTLQYIKVMTTKYPELKLPDFVSLK